MSPLKFGSLKHEGKKNIEHGGNCLHTDSKGTHLYSFVLSVLPSIPPTGAPYMMQTHCKGYGINIITVYSRPQIGSPRVARILSRVLLVPLMSFGDHSRYYATCAK